MDIMTFPSTVSETDIDCSAMSAKQSGRDDSVSHQGKHSLISLSILSSLEDDLICAEKQNDTKAHLYDFLASCPHATGL